LIILGLVVLTAIWWLFRPERLFVNVHVDEAAPVGIADSQPVFTGSLKPSSNLGEIHGRVNILKKGNSLELEISNLESKGPQSFDVAIAPDANSWPTARRLGTITAGRHERFTIPAGSDLYANKTVLLTDGPNRLMATATLEPF
jgi:hypothetical protein